MYMFCNDMKAQPSFSQKLGVPMLQKAYSGINQFRQILRIFLVQVGRHLIRAV